MYEEYRALDDSASFTSASFMSTPTPAEHAIAQQFDPSKVWQTAMNGTYVTTTDGKTFIDNDNNGWFDELTLIDASGAEWYFAAPNVEGEPGHWVKYPSEDDPHLHHSQTIDG